MMITTVDPTLGEPSNVHEINRYPDTVGARSVTDSPSLYQTDPEGLATVEGLLETDSRYCLTQLKITVLGPFITMVPELPDPLASPE